MSGVRLSVSTDTSDPCSFCAAPNAELEDEYGEPYCSQPCADEHEQNRAEAAYELSLDDYYGGSGPVTVQEHYRAAAAAKGRPA